MFYLLILFYLGLRLVLSAEESVYAGFSINVGDLASAMPINMELNDRLYFSYYNSVQVPVHLDNVNNGMAILTHLDGSAEKRAGHLEGWCYMLTMYTIYPKVTNTLARNAEIIDIFYNHCMQLNDNETEVGVDAFLKSGSLIQFTDLTKHDVYLFEKWARLCPCPLYLQEDNVLNCKDVSRSAAKDVLSDLNNNRACYFNDFIDLNWISQSELCKRTVDCEKSLDLFRDKWFYVDFPKQAEHEFAFHDLSKALLLKLLSIGKSDYLFDINSVLTNLAHQLIVKFIIGDIYGSDERKGTISAAVLFNIDSDVIPEIRNKFDFFITENEGEQVTNKLVSLTSSEDRLINYEREKGENPPPYTFSYDNITGLGQHRTVDVNVNLDAKIFEYSAKLDRRYFLKISHMLESSVYIDQSELDTYYHIVSNEGEILKGDVKVKNIADSIKSVPNAHVGSDSLFEGTNGETSDPEHRCVFSLSALYVPYLSIEDHVNASSPVIYHGYLVLDESVLSCKSITVTYRLPLHARYLHMCKSRKRETNKLNKSPRRYELAFISQPLVFVYQRPLEITLLNSTDHIIAPCLKFMNKVAFSRAHSGTKPIATVEEYLWKRVYLKGCNNAVEGVNLVNVNRTGPAFVTNQFTFRNNTAVDTQHYLVFSVPIANQNHFYFVLVLTIITIALFVANAAVETYYYLKKIHKYKTS